MISFTMSDFIRFEYDVTFLYDSLNLLINVRKF